MVRDEQAHVSNPAEPTSLVTPKLSVHNTIITFHFLTQRKISSLHVADKCTYNPLELWTLKH
jgi:hypothetical protein